MKRVKDDILWRIRLVYAVIALFAIVIIGKVIYIQVVEGEQWREMARNATMRYVSIDAARGDIRADDGRLLATSIPVYEIRMDLSRSVVSDDIFRAGLDSLCQSLSALFQDRSPAQYRAELLRARKSQERYFLIKRNVSYNELHQLRQFPIFRLGRLRGGLVVNERTRREMPYRSLAARTIGYEREGVYVGLEGAYRQYLEGTKGKRLMQRTSGGHWMPINDDNEIQPKNGMDVISTINVRMQDIAENALRKQLEKHQADYGTLVVMEVSSGKVKAISNLRRSPRGIYEESFNFAVGESTEPGSTFKLASMIAILDEGLAKPDDVIDTGNGRITFHDRVMRDALEGGFGTITLKEAFELSSNVAISRIIHQAYRENPQRFIDKLRSMGLGEPLGLEISGEGQPHLPEVNSPSWSAITLPWMAIGYGLSFTPLQILALYNAVANNGVMMKPMFVEEIRQTGTTIKRFQPVVLNRSVANATTIATLKEMLTGTVEQGTAKGIYNPVYKIAGKTGTAQVAQTRHGYHSESGVSYQASFAGFFPAGSPIYSMIVVIHNPKGYAYTGSQLAAPVFREVADKIFATQLMLPAPIEATPAMAALPAIKASQTSDLKNIYAGFSCKLIDQTTGIWATATVNTDTVKLIDIQISEHTMPDLRGVGMRDAVYILENAGATVRFNGRGIVRTQSLPPGTKIAPNQTIILGLQ